MKVTVWLNYHSEGWSPNEFNNEAAAVEFIKSGRTYQPFRVTTEVDLLLSPAKEEPK